MFGYLIHLHRPVKYSDWTDCVPRSKRERVTSLSKLSSRGSTIFGPLMPSQEAPNAVTKNDFLKGFKLIAKHGRIAKYVTYNAIQMIGIGTFNTTFAVVSTSLGATSNFENGTAKKANGMPTLSLKSKRAASYKFNPASPKAAVAFSN